MPCLYWEPPARLPKRQLGAVRGHHPRPTIVPIYIFSRSAFPYMAAGDMREERTQPLRQSDLLRGSEERPSGLKFGPGSFARSEEHTSELQSLMRISYAVFCLKKKNNTI